MDLMRYDNKEFDRGCSIFKEFLWVLISGLFFSTWIPGSAWRITALRIFGAKIGSNVVIKPRAKIKFPWKLSVGDNTWIGESAWVDNLAQVDIGSNVCISQGVYLCTGSHDWISNGFDLIVKQITIQDQVWLGAYCRLGPGVVVAKGAVLSLGSIATKSLSSNSIYKGNPAKFVKLRYKLPEI